MEGKWLKDYRAPASADWLMGALATTNIIAAPSVLGTAVRASELGTLSSEYDAMRTPTNRLLISDGELMALVSEFHVVRVYRMADGTVIKVYKHKHATSKERGRWIAVDVRGRFWDHAPSEGAHCFTLGIRGVAGVAGNRAASALFREIGAARRPAHAPERFEDSAEYVTRQGRRESQRKAWAKVNKGRKPVRKGKAGDAMAAMVARCSARSLVKSAA